MDGSPNQRNKECVFKLLQLSMDAALSIPCYCLTVEEICLLCFISKGYTEKKLAVFLCRAHANCMVWIALIS